MSRLGCTLVRYTLGELRYLRSLPVTLFRVVFARIMFSLSCFMVYGFQWFCLKEMERGGTQTNKSVVNYFHSCDLSCICQFGICKLSCRQFLSGLLRIKLWEASVKAWQCGSFLFGYWHQFFTLSLFVQGCSKLGPFPGSGWVTPIGILHFSVVGGRSVISRLRLLSPGRGLRLYFLNWGISVLISLLPFPLFLDPTLNETKTANLLSGKRK